MQVSLTRMEEMAGVKDDLELKLLLWESRDTFDAITAGWRSAQFDSLDVTAIEEVIAQ